MLLLIRHWLTGAPAPKKRRVVGSTFERVARQSESIHPRRRGIVLLMSCLLFQPVSGPEFKQVRRVAVFYELGLSSPAVALLDREMRAVLENSRYQIELYPEYLETTLFEDPADQQKFRESYIRKISKP